MTRGSVDGQRARVIDATRERNGARGVRGTERAAGYSSSLFASQRDRRVETRVDAAVIFLQSRSGRSLSQCGACRWSRARESNRTSIERRDDDGDDGDDASSGGGDDDGDGGDDDARRTEGRRRAEDGWRRTTRGCRRPRRTSGTGRGRL